MKRYENYPEDAKLIDFTKFVIVVPTENDRKEMVEATKHIHNSDIDTDYITVNQLAHVYEEDDFQIVVDENLYNRIKTRSYEN